MIFPTRSSRFLIGVIFAFSALGVFDRSALLRAQIPNTLRHAIFSPSEYPQADVQQGSALAVDGSLAVVGASADDTGGTDSGVVKIFNTTTGQLLHTIVNPTPQSSDRFGISVAISGTRIAVGAYGDEFGGLDSGRAYVFDVSTPTPTTPIATLNNPTPAQGDNFGWAVAISGTRVIVGARQNDTPTANAGSAYVYDLSGATPTVPIVTLDNPAPQADDTFGYSVAIDGTRAVVGAPGDDAGANSAGVAYVYNLVSATPTVPILTLNNPGPSSLDRFGQSVAISGTRVMVPVLSDDVGPSTNAGSVYIYELTSATPNVPALTLNDVITGDTFFGFGAGISGHRVAVGARRSTIGGTGRSGIVFIFDLTSGTPRVPVRTINEPSPNAGDEFGGEIAIAGQTVVVSAPNDDTFERDAGRTWVFDVTGPEPLQPTASLDAPSAAAEDNFGRAVVLSGTWMIVGAECEDTAGEDAGSAYVYDIASVTPTVPIIELHNPIATNSSDYFGRAVAISGRRAVVALERSGNGRVFVYDLESATPSVPILTVQDPSTGTNFFGAAVAIAGTYVAIGAYGDNTGASDAGRVSVYNLANANPGVPIATINNPAPASTALFGISLAASGTRLAVGARANRVNGVTAGMVYVFDLASATPAAPIFTLANPAPTAEDQFGQAVGMSGSLLVAGAPLDDQGATNAGRAYVYNLGAATPTVPVATLNNPSPATDDHFGNSVAVSGNRVVVGAASDDFGNTDAGRAYVYQIGGPNQTVPVATLNKPSPEIFDEFGSSVAIDGLIVAVGAPFDDSTVADKGAVYVFGPETNPPAGGTFTVLPASPVVPGATMTASAAGWTDASPPLTYQFFLNGAALGAASSSPSANFAAPAAPGSHQVKLRVTDAAGNFAEMERTFIVNGPPAGGTLVVTPEVAAPGATIQLSAPGWTDPQAPLTYQFFLAGVPLAPAGTSSTASFAAPPTLGSYSLKVRVADGLGLAVEVEGLLVVNNPPVVRASTLGAVAGSTAEIAVAKLLRYASDPDGETMQIIAVSPASAQGGTITLLTGVIRYSAPAGYSGPDSFTYIVRDASGSQATGTVNITVATGSGPSLNVVSITQTADGFLVRFAGIPGESYQIQYRDVQTAPWQTLNPPGALIAGPNGIFEHEDKPNPKPISRFYRAIAP